MSESFSKTPSKRTALQYVEGFPIPAIFSADSFRSAIKYKPREDDIFVVTYPKCGTTWAHQVLVLILRHGEPLGEFFKTSLLLEIAGAEFTENMPRPGAIKTHIPFRLIPWSDKAKYTYVARNPKDCCVSFYHHMKNMPGHRFDGTFDEFFELFISGEIDFGDYFDQLLDWYKHRNDPNVLFITYEEMKEDIEAAILKMASFIDDNLYAEPLRNDRDKLNNVIKYSSLQFMKEKINKDMDALFSMSKEEALNSDLPSTLKKMVSSHNSQGEQNTQNHNPSNFVRKGIVGDWKNYFNDDQSKRLSEKFSKRTQGTDLPKFWMKYME